MRLERLYRGPVEDQVWKVLIPEGIVLKRVYHMARRLQKLIDAAERPVVLAFIGNGGFWLGYKLAGILAPQGYRWGIMMASSYGGGQTAGRLQMTLDALGDVAGCTVVVVDDIFDTGHTMDFLREYLIHCKKAAEVKIAVLLEKPTRKDPNVSVAPDFVGLVIPNTFVAGCGLDGGEEFGYTRNFPEIRYRDEAPEEPWYTIPLL